MIGNKGQAFDTFKLMIAAVVAVAILGILLSILGGISPPGQEPIPMIKDQLTKAYGSPGGKFASTSEATFKTDEFYPSSIFEASTGGKVVKFECSDSFSGCDDSTSSGLTITSMFKAKVYACCPQSSSSISTCLVGIGKSGISC